MFGKIFSVALLAVATMANPAPWQQTCDTGSINCCASTTTTASNPVVSLLTELLGVVVGADTPIGLTCSPITVSLLIPIKDHLLTDILLTGRWHWVRVDLHRRPCLLLRRHHLGYVNVCILFNVF